MKLPNWLHRKPAEFDFSGWCGGDPRPEVPPPDPYLASLEKKVMTYDEARTALMPEPESIEGARTRGYWEGRAESDLHRVEPKYRVEVVRNEDGSGDNSIDEVLLHDATRCLLHLERLDNDHWWITLSPTGGWDDEVTFDIFRVKKCIEVTEQ